MKQIKLVPDEFWPLLNILNEACHGIKIIDFEKIIGVKKQTVIDFINSLAKEENKSEITLNLNDIEVVLLKNSLEEVCRQINEWEFQTRIGISLQKARKIQEKFK